MVAIIAMQWTQGDPVDYMDEMLQSVGDRPDLAKKFESVEAADKWIEFLGKDPDHYHHKTI